MAIKQAQKAPLSGELNPNDAGYVAQQVGQLYVRTDTEQLFFAMSAQESKWGTCGTAGG